MSKINIKEVLITTKGNIMNQVNLLYRVAKGKNGHINISSDMKTYLFNLLSENDNTLLQKIIDGTRGDHWNDFSHNGQKVIMEYISQNPDNPLTTILLKSTQIKSYLAFHKILDIQYALEKGTLKVGKTTMDGHTITQEMADKCQNIYDLYKQRKQNEAAKLVKKVMKEKWLSTRGAKSSRIPKIGDTKKALKSILEPKTALKNMHKAGKGAAAIQSVIVCAKDGYKIFVKGEELDTVDACLELVKEASGAYVSCAVGAQVAATTGVLMLALTPAGWVVIPSTLAAGIASTIATKKGYDTVWGQIGSLPVMKNINDVIKSKNPIPTIKGKKIFRFPKEKKLLKTVDLAELYPKINHDYDSYKKYLDLELKFKKKYNHAWNLASEDVMVDTH